MKKNKGQECPQETQEEENIIEIVMIKETKMGIRFTDEKK